MPMLANANVSVDVEMDVHAHMHVHESPKYMCLQTRRSVSVFTLIV